MRLDPTRPFNKDSGGPFQNESDLMNHDFNENDEILDQADSAHDEKDMDVEPNVPSGVKVIRDGKHNFLPVNDIETQTHEDYVQQHFDKESVENVDADPAPKSVKVGVAREQRQASYNDAMKKGWDATLKQDEGMRVASGFKPKGKAAKQIVEESPRAEPWYIKQGIEHGYIKGDKSRLNETLYQFFNDFNDVVDAFGIIAASVDHGIQKDGNGKLVFVGAMTIDRRQRAVSREDGQSENGSENRVRVRTKQAHERVETLYGKGYYDKEVKIPITDPGAVDNAGYNPARGDLLLAERIADTKHRAEEVAVAVGPLLPELLKAVLENATGTEIGESLGFEQPRASAVGNAWLQRALEAAGDAYARIKKRARRELTYADWLREQPDGMPIPARKLKQAYDMGSKIKAGIIKEADQATALAGIVIPANDNLPLAPQQKSTEIAA